MTPRTLKLLKWPSLILWTAFLIFTGRCGPATRPVPHDLSAGPAESPNLSAPAPPGHPKITLLRLSNKTDGMIVSCKR